MVNGRLALVAMMALAGLPCQRAGDVPGGDTVVLATSAQSGWPAAAALVYRDQAHFAAAWDTLFANPPRSAAPAVDFSTRRAVIVTAGTRPTGGFRLGFDSARATGDTLRLMVTLVTPAPGCPVTQELTAPALALSVPPTPPAIDVVRRERPDTTHCS